MISIYLFIIYNEKLILITYFYNMIYYIYMRVMCILKNWTIDNLSYFLSSLESII